MAAYYNENDPFAAAWLRQLIKRDVIAQGEVDERDIREVTAADLRGFTQCHFFAGIGVWAYALRQAGWPDTKCAWTGSCPCQPFSVSGTRKAAQDGRHLWPVWFPLVRESKPVTIFGEQVASDDGLAWLDVVSFDLENAGYTIGAVDTCAAGFGAPQLSQRLYFVATSESDSRGLSGQSGRSPECGAESIGSGEAGDVAAPDRGRCEQRNAGQRPVQITNANSADGQLGAAQCARLEGYGGDVPDGSEPGRIHKDADGPTATAGESSHVGAPTGGRFAMRGRAQGNDGQRTQPSETNGFWADAEWIPCSDGKARPVESGTFPLAYGAARRVGRLRGYGNALVAPQATAFIKAYMSLCP